MMKRRAEPVFRARNVRRGPVLPCRPAHCLLALSAVVISSGMMGIPHALAEPIILSDATMDNLTAGTTISKTFSNGALSLSVSRSWEVVHDGDTTLRVRSLSFALSKGGDATATTTSAAGDSFASAAGTATASGGDKNLAHSITAVSGTSSSGHGTSVSLASGSSAGTDLQASTGGEVRSDNQTIYVAVGPGTTLSAYATGGSFGYTAATGSGSVQLLSIARSDGSTLAVAGP